MRTNKHQAGGLQLPVAGLEVDILLGKAWLQGELRIPPDAKGMVLFAHGSGSSRFSARSQFVANEFNSVGLATCLFDLLSLEEECEDQRTSQYRYDIPLLASRLEGITDWLEEHLSKERQSLYLGYFAAGTGAGAALIAASERAELVKAVVSRGGRPDMAGHALSKVQAATLFLVGEMDEVVLALSRQAYHHLPPHTPKEMVVISGAGHLFEEPGKLSYVAQAASQWFEQYLSPKHPSDIS